MEMKNDTERRSRYAEMRIKWDIKGRGRRAGIRRSDNEC